MNTTVKPLKFKEPTRMKVYNILALLAHLYASDCYKMKAKDKIKITAFEIKFMRQEVNWNRL
jgi:hypothetical protein